MYVYGNEEKKKQQQQLLNHRAVGGSCDRCPTDFSVRASDAGLEITVWQDFGPEASVTDVWWQSHVPGPVLQSMAPNTWQSGLTVEHDPGSVRALFETGDTADSLLRERKNHVHRRRWWW
ncbi:hypothetical protein HMPREF1624_05654 [Sporothrix schenckii ATCC 58251]|uniref:Uncharacterized protein n=1 Tax=Sporothrix schenckii (strain ATCC 58251 / de Perez 2211183) TaxID=1391915 RepID=U7PRD7_SPOS1|nr:hypothetical protein HMPREF1624_05654 [Sporothrix schenckii ATCC 58251]